MAWLPGEPTKRSSKFIAAGPTVQKVVAFRPSKAVRERVALVLQREKTAGLSPEEASELHRYAELEHLMRLAKARAQQPGRG